MASSTASPSLVSYSEVIAVDLLLQEGWKIADGFSQVNFTLDFTQAMSAFLNVSCCSAYCIAVFDLFYTNTPRLFFPILWFFFSMGRHLCVMFISSLSFLRGPLKFLL